jgi:voltage-gated potassium channel
VKESDLFRPLRRSGMLVLTAFIVGIAGFLILGGAEHGWINAVYMTVITLTTVGYTEVIDLSDSPGGRIFTTFLLLYGVGTFLYFFSTLTAFLVEGHVQRVLWRRRMQKMIEKLSGHTIVCGCGHTGEHIVEELINTGRPFAVVEIDEARVADLPERLGREFPVVLGDATDDDALRAAGIERAAGLVACVSGDKDNLIATVSARLLNPSLRIVCRCIDERMEDKLRKAGADAIVSPNRIGGLRMVSEMVRPTAVSYLDLMLRDRERNLRVESTLVESGAVLDGASIGELKEQHIQDLLVLALSVDQDHWLFAPSDDTRIRAGSSVIYRGAPGAREAVERIASAAGR